MARYTPFSSQKENIVSLIPERHESTGALIDVEALNWSFDKISRIPEIDLSFGRLGETGRDDSVEGAEPFYSRAFDSRVRVGDGDGSGTGSRIEESQFLVLAGSVNATCQRYSRALCERCTDVA